MKLSKFFKWYFLVSLATVFLSGMGWWGLHEIAWLHVHGISVYFFMLGMGYLIHSHVRPGLKLNRRARTGVFFLLVIATLTVTAFPLLYAGEGKLRDMSIWLHTVVGLSLPLTFTAHLAAGFAARFLPLPPSMTKAHA